MEKGGEAERGSRILNHERSDDVYNPDLKERFLREATDSEHTRKIYRAIFGAIEEFEEEAGMDVCEMDAATGKPLADSLMNVSGKSVEKRLILVKQYVRWCVRNEIPGASLAFVDVVPMPPYGKLRSKMVSGPRMMADYLNSVFDRPEKRSVHNVYRCYLWLGFIGVASDLAGQVTATDVSIPERIVRSEGMEFEIPEEAVPELRNCVELTGFATEYGNTTRFTPRGCGQAILRNLSETPNIEGLWVRTSKFRKDAQDKGRTDKAVTYSYARLSGIFCRAFRMEMAGLAVDLRKEAERLEDENERKNPDINPETRRARVNVRTNGLADDYQRWKLVFCV